MTLGGGDIEQFEQDERVRLDNVEVALVEQQLLLPDRCGRVQLPQGTGLFGVGFFAISVVIIRIIIIVVVINIIIVWASNSFAFDYLGDHGQDGVGSSLLVVGGDGARGVALGEVAARVHVWRKKGARGGRRRRWIHTKIHIDSRVTETQR